MASVLVVGSANLDSAVQVQEHPRPGETVLGRPIDVGAGGKGLNQAIAACRAGTPTVFAGAVGPDAAGNAIQQALSGAQVSSCVATAAGQPTGSAFVMVAPSGENAIVVVPGANADLAPLTAAMNDGLATLRRGDVLLTQLEIPIDVVVAAHRGARAHDAVTVLNAAPSGTLPSELLELTDVLVVNEHECLDIAVTEPDVESAALALATHVAHVIVTLGGAGALLAASGEVRRFDAHTVDVVDTTAAGDTFCGALVAEVAAGSALAEAVEFGIAAAAVTVQHHGASASIPERQAILESLDRHRARAATANPPGGRG